MRITYRDHIGIAVENLQEAIRYYEKVPGLTCSGMEEVTDQNVSTALLCIGDFKLELLEATAPDSTVAKFIEKKGSGLHHLAFAVEAFQNAFG